MCALEVDLVMVLPYRSFSYAYPLTEQGQGDVRQNGQCQIPSKKLRSNKYAGASGRKAGKTRTKYSCSPDGACVFLLLQSYSLDEKRGYKSQQGCKTFMSVYIEGPARLRGRRRTYRAPVEGSEPNVPTVVQNNFAGERSPSRCRPACLL